MNRIFTFFAVAFSFALIGCETDDSIEAPTKDQWQTYSEDGLGDYSVFALIQDRTGTIWAGTEGNGIYKFREGQWTHMSASSSTFLDDWVYCLKEDPQGNIWVGSWDGISKYTGSSWSTHYTQGPVNAIEYYEPRESMYFGLAGYGFVIYSSSGYDERVFFDTTMNDINALYADSRGLLWFGTTNGILRMNSFKDYTLLRVENGLSSNNVNRFFEDSHDRLWIGYKGGSVVQWFENNSFNNAPLGSGLDYHYIFSIGEDMFGNLWFGTVGLGAYKYNGSLMEPFGSWDGLCNNTILSILCDRENHLWFGGYEGGITRLTQSLPTK
jgi:ligand-binding sensor domain-containing protein